MRRLWVGTLVAATGMCVSACADRSASSDTRAAGPPVAGTVHVRAVLTSTHPVQGREKTFHAPLSGYDAVAVGQGTRLTAPIDETGVAVLHLPPGTYSVATSLADACPPITVTAKPDGDVRIRLKCVAP
jgi:hypothetical protein